MPKRCNICKEIKSLEQFYCSHKTRSGSVIYSSRCKSCDKALGKEWVKKNRERRKDIELKHLYGITLGQYELMFKAQAGVCKICEKPPSANKRLNVDHDHDSLKVRGLLCTPCNQALGHFHDDLEKLKKAVKYLESYA